jgi:predicted acylesterase/phospholipase RssA
MKKILVLSGGGSHGSFEMGVVSKLIQDDKGGWDLITGVSAGSINGSYLCTIDKKREKEFIKDFKVLWANLKNKDIFEGEYFFNGLSMYNSNKYKCKLEEIFENKLPKRPLIISSTSLNTSRSKIFNFKDIKTYGFVDPIMCSSSVPLVFQPYNFLDDMFVDGGLTSNVLLIEAVNYCLKYFPTETIHIDVVICTKLIETEKIDKDKFHFNNLLQRLIGIVEQQIEYFELLKNEKFPCKIDITVYEQKENSKYSFLDFDHGEEQFNSGFTFENVKEYKLEI